MDRSIQHIRKRLDQIMLVVSLVCSAAVIFNLGYNSDLIVETTINRALEWCFIFFAAALALKAFTVFHSRAFVVARAGEAILLLYFIFVIAADSYHFSGRDGTSIVSPEWMYVGIFTIFIIEVSKQTVSLDRFHFNPTLLFVLSFLLLILIGTALLLLPKSTNGAQLAFIDAVFLSTSAVCVTGLSVIDIGSQLTLFGQTVILVLVQVGGLGIMTFTGFFGYFFTGAGSYRNQLMFTELIGENKISSVFSTLYKIILVTFFFEIVGGVLIFVFSNAEDFTTFGNRLYFSIFHTVMSFCNAGFSNLSQGLSDSRIRFNYPLQLSVISIYVIGGLGFGIVFNSFDWIRRRAYNLYRRTRFGKPFVHRARVITFNSRIIAYTSFFLIALGTVAVLLLEREHTLREHSSYFGKLVTSLFIATTPRTAGFNTVMMTDLAFPTVMLTFLLMWIGAAPGSTGGGIKVTTFALAMLNIFSRAKGVKRIEIFGRNVSDDSLGRAFAIISLSLVFLGFAIFALTITDPDQNLLSLAFEAFSAYSTTGLSLGVTPQLSSAGKLVIVCTMFVGRVGSLTLLVALVKKATPKNYRLPDEQVNL